jgi:hypothetical protein
MRSSMQVDEVALRDHFYAAILPPSDCRWKNVAAEAILFCLQAEFNGKMFLVHLDERHHTYARAAGKIDDLDDFVEIVPRHNCVEGDPRFATKTEFRRTHLCKGLPHPM